MGAGVAAHSGDNRVDRRQRDDLFDCAGEDGDDGRGQKRCKQIDKQPRQTAFQRFDQTAVDFFFLIDLRQSVDIFRVFFFNDVHDVVNGDDAENMILLVHNRHHQEAVLAEYPRDFLLIGRGRHGDDVRIGDVADLRVKAVSDDFPQGNDSVSTLL